MQKEIFEQPESVVGNGNMINKNKNKNDKYIK